jgi:homopolymeric O-antigen transport system permease protein
MDPHRPPSVSITSLCRSLWRNRQLILQMTKRDIIGRYKGSILGLMWSFFNPLCLLGIYTFVFSVVFKARWGGDFPDDKSKFALMLFVGMIVHGLFAEILNRAPGLILSNVSYVKKILFPLEILPISSMGAALFHTFISLIVLLTAFIFVNGFIQWTTIFLPLILVPLLILSLGFAWILSSIGVFLRDVAQPIGMVITILLFASPVFYPISALPDFARPWIMLNPLSFIIEQARAVLILGQLPNWNGISLYSLASFSIAWAGYAWFQKTRKGFANVL